MIMFIGGTVKNNVILHWGHGAGQNAKISSEAPWIYIWGGFSRDEYGLGGITITSANSAGLGVVDGHWIGQEQNSAAFGHATTQGVISGAISSITITNVNSVTWGADSTFTLWGTT